MLLSLALLLTFSNNLDFNGWKSCKILCPAQQEFGSVILFLGSAFGYTASLFIARQLKKKSQFLLGASIMIVSSG